MPWALLDGVINGNTTFGVQLDMAVAKDRLLSRTIVGSAWHNLASTSTCSTTFLESLMPENPQELLAQLEGFMYSLMDAATGGSIESSEYREMRAMLLSTPHLQQKLPEFLRPCRDPGAFWEFIKEKFGTYRDRRTYLRNQFEPLLVPLEEQVLTGKMPADQAVSAVLASVNSEYVHSDWLEALDLRQTDPDGAIRAARTLLESVCKYILDESNVPYREGQLDLHGLYSQATKQLNMHPTQHTEKVFKQILSGCISVVEGLGAMRNRMSDAHGKGRRSVKPLPRHAELAVNLAGSMATYLIASWETKRQSTGATEAMEANSA